jgi:hypothetical protein
VMVSATSRVEAVTVTGQMERGTFVRADAGSQGAPAATVPTTTEDLRRAYYTGPGASWEWWVVEIDLDPAQLIVENDSDGNLYRVPYSVTGAGQVEFGEAVAIQVDYVDAPSATPAATAGARRVAASLAVGARTPLMVFASRAQSRPAAAATPPQEEHTTVDPQQLTLLGLPADATPEQINARLTELAALETPPEGDGGTGEGGDTPPVETPPVETPPAETPPATPPAQVTVPDGAVLVDAEQWAEVQRQAAAGAQVAANQATRDRDTFLEAAVTAGKFAPARLTHWRNQWEVDPEGVRATIEAFPDGLIPVSLRGHTQVSETGDGTGEGYPSHWLPELAGKRKSIFSSDNRGEG